jgi:hypothetical protein
MLEFLRFAPNSKFSVVNAFAKKMNSGPSKKTKELHTSYAYFVPHLLWLDFLCHHYDGIRGSSADHTVLYLRFVQASGRRHGQNR